MRILGLTGLKLKWNVITIGLKTPLPERNLYFLTAGILPNNESEKK